MTDLENKVKGGWLGKVAGVCIGAEHEFMTCNHISTAVIDYYPDIAGGMYGQDDIYMQPPFFGAMDAKLNQANGIFAARMVDYGNAFKATTYGLYCGNDVSRGLLQSGVLPPLSGMWGGTTATRKNGAAEAIDFQIECDWIGFMCPAMPQTSQRLCDSVGHVIGYADGLYGGYFITAMDALAFRYSDIHTIVRKALSTLPPRSDYYKIVSDVVTFHDNNPSQDYKACWQNVIMTKGWLTVKNDICGTDGCDDNVQPYTANLWSGINGAIIAIGLMYGDGDLLKTLEYTIRSGQDADCNAASAAAVIGIILGYTALPQEWKTSVASNPTQKFESSNYTYDSLINSSINRAKKCITQMGGSLSGTTCTINAEEPQQPRMLEMFGADPVVNPDFQATAARPSLSRRIRPAAVLAESSFRTYDLAGRSMHVGAREFPGVFIVERGHLRSAHAGSPKSRGLESPSIEN